MMQDSTTNNFIGVGEHTVFSILKSLTQLKPRETKEFPKTGIYKQVPLKKLIHRHDFNMLSQEHQKGSVDIVLVNDNKAIAIRVQGKGHGQGEKHHGRYSLKNPHKVRHDKVQADLIKKYNFLVDININECPDIFKERLNENSRLQLINSFKTANVLIPIAKESV